MWLLFVPLALVIAFFLALGLLAIGVASLLGAAWPVLLILLGIWMFMRDGKRARRANAWRHGTVEATVIRDWPRQMEERHEFSGSEAGNNAWQALFERELANPGPTCPTPSQP